MCRECIRNRIEDLRKKRTQRTFVYGPLKLNYGTVTKYVCFCFYINDNNDKNTILIKYSSAYTFVLN